MDSHEQPHPQKAFRRLTRLILYKRVESRQAERAPETPETDINSGSAFLQLSVKLRMRIYKYAFSRSPAERFDSLYRTSQPNSAGGLMLTCRQTRKEAWQLYHQDVVISLWPQWHQPTLPHNNSILNSKNPILQSWLQSRSGITLVKHPSTVQQLDLLISLRRETKTTCENFIEADIIQNAHLDIKDLYIRLCICGSLRWLQQTPQDVISFCIALEIFASHFSTIERIHILYCGQHWPLWIQAAGDIPFPEMIIAMQEMRAASGGGWNIRKVSAERESWEESMAARNSTQSRPTDGLYPKYCEDICKLRTVITWSHEAVQEGQAMQQALWKERHVDINYYDSRMILRQTCVRNKLPQPKKNSAISSTKLTKKPTSLERSVAAAKDFVERVPLGPTWGLHKYAPATKDAGAEDRGSHWRRY